jgi:cytochrome P450
VTNSGGTTRRNSGQSGSPTTKTVYPSRSSRSGAGPRRCIGEQFAWAEAKLIVAALFDAFIFERETEMFASLTTVPDRPIELTAHMAE